MRPNENALPNGRLRSPAQTRPFEVLLLEPEIPPNTGNIARICAATSCPLHLVGKLGFSLDEHAVRRAGLDYWPLVQVIQHVDLDAASLAIAESAPEPERRFWLFSGKATKSFYDAPIKRGDVFVFGKESAGLPDALLEKHSDDVVGLPTLGAVRSLNLANVVAIAIYEGLRQIGALIVDPLRR